MNRSIALAAMLALNALFLAACGDDCDEASPSGTPQPVATATATVSTNQPPVLEPIEDLTVVLGRERLVAVVATDPEGDPVTLSAEGLPSNSYFLPASGIFCFTASDESQIDNPAEVTFTASDGVRRTSQTVTIHVVRPSSVEPTLQFDPIGDHTVPAGTILTLRIAAHGATPIRYEIYPEPALAPLISFDPDTGVFRFAPTAAEVDRSFEVTFHACVPRDDGCDPVVQVHETIHLSVIALGNAPCPDYVPAGCTELDSAAELPQPVESCYVIRKAGSYYFNNYINILANGGLYFVEDPSGEIDFRVNSLLVEKGGVLQAGSPTCPFGDAGGTLSIGLYGDDPSMEGKIDPAPVGIRCMTDPMSSHSGCFPAGRDPEDGTFYCTVPDSDDPCSATTPPTQDPDNYLLEHYGNLNFDPTPWGYKTLGVSYGGTLRLFGFKGAKTTPDDPDHCDAPTPQQSTLDAAEMQAWADLTYSSWARLAGTQDTGDTTIITLDREVPSWAQNDEIVIGTTDWYPSHSELRTVLAPPTVVGGRTQLTVAKLDYPHVSSIFDTDVLKNQYGADYTGPVTRKAADLRAVVGLLTRSITIHSLGTTADDDFPDVASCLFQEGAAQLCSNTAAGCPCGSFSTTDPSCYFGGHLIFRQGFKEVQVQGVEVRQLGQGGRMGHYPVHFHLAKSTAYTQGKAFLKDSSVWDSMTRFVTLHGTHNVAVSRNVGYLSMGHGYYIEDGSEINNLLCHNVGIEARAALKEYFAAQAASAGPNPPLTARYVPPILDGVSPTTQFTIPGPPPMTFPLDPKGPTLRNGSDSYMPVMFWMMNAYNEFVGNAAVGVHGFGSCYWLLGSGVSGPSAPTRMDGHKFDGLAGYNLAGNYQAPLLRFRGNSCSTATYALPASAELSPAALCEAVNTGFTPMQNPYVYNPDGSLKPVTQLAGKYDRPAVVGNFQPIEPNTAGTGGTSFTNCAQVGETDAGLQPNTQSCVTTVLDRFTTSFNWAQVNYGSIWLRPWFYLLLNPAVTDQLFGGVTFVTAGSWLQVPPAYFSLAKNGLYVGVSQHGGSKYAQRSGPIFSVSATDDLMMYGPCNFLGKTTCNLVTEGIGLWSGGFNPKRLINIYDGPHFADENLFLNVGAWECDPQPCLGKAAGECVLDLPCGIYTSTFQPAPPPLVPGQLDPHKMIVLDAAIGWKQTNGFYYPPAFTYRDAHFFKTLPTVLPTPGPGPTPTPDPNALNRCYGFGPENQFQSPQFRPGDCRHNTIDRTSDYIAGDMLRLSNGPATYPVQLNLLPTTPIDFSTIIIDLNASLTGASGMVTGVENPVPTTSISRNAFFDAPAQSDECLSFGVQTSPYQAVTTNIAPVQVQPSPDAGSYIQPWTYQTTDPVTGQPITAASSPLVAIYRQWKTSKDSPDCGQVCSTNPPDQYGCTRGTFMTGPNVGHSTYLTIGQPPGLSGQPGASYYIDTSTAAMQPTTCIRGIVRNVMIPATFAANNRYVVYNLFARNDSVISYQLYVGDSVPDGDSSPIQGRYVRVTPHLTSTDNTNGLGSFRSQVIDACDPNSTGQWCSGMPKPTVQGGVLTVTLDQRPLAADYKASERADFDRCMPRDVCYFDGTQCQPCLNDPSQCIRQQDFLADDLASMNQTDATGKKPLDVVCQDWATYASGTTTETLGEISLVDCPASGCLGFAFTLPTDFVGNKSYQEKGAPLAQCYEECAWMDDSLVPRTAGMPPMLADPLCGDPRQQMSADYCGQTPCPTPTP